jgi:hypothetical protein
VTEAARKGAAACIAAAFKKTSGSFGYRAAPSLRNGAIRSSSELALAALPAERIPAPCGTALVRLQKSAHLIALLDHRNQRRRAVLFRSLLSHGKANI